MAAQPPPMTPERAKLILKDTIGIFTVPENKTRLTAAIAEAQAAPADQQAMVKMQKLVPIITELAGSKMQEYGLPNVMMGVMQIQMVAGQDPVVAEGVGLLTKCSMGQVPDDATVAAYLAKLG
jgi:hypothetical protein